MITNAATTWLISLALLMLALLNVLRVVTDYQQLEHKAESYAIQVGRSLAANGGEITDCQLLVLPPHEISLESCHIGPDSVEVNVAGQSNFLGKPFGIRAISRIGYGFYSQNYP